MSDVTADTNKLAKEKIRSFIERVERLEEEKAQIADDIKEVYAEAKGLGYDSKILRKCVALRKKDKADLAEEQAMLQIYLDALDENIDIVAS